jgi:hypothetical protein
MGSDAPIPVKRRRRRHGRIWYVAWGVCIVSALLSMFVHRGLIGITGLVGAAVVVRYTFWTAWPRFTADPPARPG